MFNQLSRDVTTLYERTIALYQLPSNGLITDDDLALARNFSEIASHLNVKTEWGKIWTAATTQFANDLGRILTLEHTIPLNTIKVFAQANFIDPVIRIL